MLIGRFVPILAVLALAGALSGKPVAPFSAGTLRTTTPTFVATLIFVIILVAALTFLPALALGPDRGRALREPVLMAARGPAPAGVAARDGRRPHGPARHPLPAGHDRRRAGAVPRQGRRQPGEAGRRGRRLRARRPGLHLAGLLPHPPLGDDPARQPVGDDVRQPRPQHDRARRTRCDGYVSRRPEARAALQPGAAGAGPARGHGHDLRLRHRPAHLGRQRPAAGRPRREGPRRAARSGCST